jgi:hypothetical protein
MRRAPTTAVRLIVLLVLAGCASAGTGIRRDRSVITEAEMREAGHHDAWSTVQVLRPQWLHARGPSTISLRESVKVYVDGSLLGGPDRLQQIAVSSIIEIRYMDGIEATQRWGLDHGLGAILVFTRRPGT